MDERKNKASEASMIYDITPMGAPRMTRADTWKKRPVVLRYYDFKDLCKKQGLTFNSGQSITFVIPFPKSYPKNKRAALLNQPHILKPDIDNLMKAVLDAIYDDDSHIWHIADMKKIWGEKGQIIIK